MYFIISQVFEKWFLTTLCVVYYNFSFEGCFYWFWCQLGLYLKVGSSLEQSLNLIPIL